MTCVYCVAKIANYFWIEIVVELREYVHVVIWSLVIFIIRIRTVV